MKRNQFRKLLAENKFVYADGGTGTTLENFLAESNIDITTVENEIANGSINFTNPEVIQRITSEYISAGSQIICANTFNINPFKAKNLGFSVCELILKALENAKIAREKSGVNDVLIACDISSTGKLLEPIGELSFEEAFEAYSEIMKCTSGFDVIIIETMSSLLETKAAVLAAKEYAPDLPVIASFTITQNGRTFTGTDLISGAVCLSAIGVDAFGVNCSFGPKDFNDVMFKQIKEVMTVTECQIMVKPNAGLPNPLTGKFSLSAEQFATDMGIFAEIGVKIIGGCCGTTPEYIKTLIKSTSNITPKRIGYVPAFRVCSGIKTFTADGKAIIGERINPNGKPKFKNAISQGDFGYLVNEAIEQEKNGADILDVNVAVAGQDEYNSMIRAVNEIQKISPLPLMLDSTDERVLEAALRVYEGKAIINSTNGEPSVMKKIMPLAKKYGASLVALTMDEHGIPTSSDGRLEIARRIVETAKSYGISETELILDCLTFSIATEKDAVKTTIDSIKLVKSEFNVKTTLGVSNISFGLPAREHITSAFLTLALDGGLDFCIINPMNEKIKGAYDSHLAFNGDMEYYISVYANNATKVNLSSQNSEIKDLKELIIFGLKAEAENEIKRLLLSDYKDGPLKLADDFIIPALDVQGIRFEKSEIFLPSLIMSADAASACFDIIRERILKSSVKNEQNPKRIILAAVKGDVHDIGKNIVKVILQSYGFEIIDLGKNVSPETVLKAAIEGNIKLVGLSALMTTTLTAMEETVKLLKAENKEIQVMVGGAVLNQEYATKIGADFYGENASQSAEFARSIFNDGIEEL